MYEKFTELGVPVFDESDNRFAAEIRTTLSEFELQDSLPPALSGKHLSDQLEPYDPQGGIFMGSTDVGDVSWKVPTVQCTVACVALGTPFHTWQVVSQGATSIAHKGMLHAGKVIGATALELMLKPELLTKAKEEHVKELGGRPYKCPIPDDVKPGPVKR
jgi:aminobenzoyl-glutamate utilization protein B